MLGSALLQPARSVCVASERFFIVCVFIEYSCSIIVHLQSFLNK